MLEVLIGVGTFSSTSSFDTQCLLFVTMNELKKSMPGGLQFFSFSLGNFIQCLLSVGIRSYFTQRYVCRKSSSQHFSVEVKHNLHIALMNNTPPNRLSVDFIHFKYRFSSAFKHRTD